MSSASEQLCNGYLRRNMPTIVTKVKVREIIPHLPCLTAQDKENIEAKREAYGNYDSMGLLLDCLKRRENWPDQFIGALEACDHVTIAAEIRAEYEALKGNDPKPGSPPTTVVKAHIHPTPPAAHLSVPEGGGDAVPSSEPSEPVDASSQGEETTTPPEVPESQETQEVPSAGPPKSAEAEGSSPPTTPPPSPVTPHHQTNTPPPEEAEVQPDQEEISQPDLPEVSGESEVIPEVEVAVDSSPQPPEAEETDQAGHPEDDSPALSPSLPQSASNEPKEESLQELIPEFIPEVIPELIPELIPEEPLGTPPVGVDVSPEPEEISAPPEIQVVDVDKSSIIETQPAEICEDPEELETIQTTNHVLVDPSDNSEPLEVVDVDQSGIVETQTAEICEDPEELATIQTPNHVTVDPSDNSEPLEVTGDSEELMVVDVDKSSIIETQPAEICEDPEELATIQTPNHVTVDPSDNSEPLEVVDVDKSSIIETQPAEICEDPEELATIQTPNHVTVDPSDNSEPLEVVDVDKSSIIETQPAEICEDPEELATIQTPNHVTVDPSDNSEPLEVTGDSEELGIVGIEVPLVFVCAPVLSETSASPPPCLENGVAIDNSKKEEEESQAEASLEDEQEIAVVPEPSEPEEIHDESLPAEPEEPPGLTIQNSDTPAINGKTSSPVGEGDSAPSKPIVSLQVPPKKDSPPGRLTPNTKYILTAASVGACALLMAWRFKH